MGEGADKAPKGPRGGTTTVSSSGHVKKNLWIERDDAEWLRTIAYEERRTEASIIRLGLHLVRQHWEREGEWPEP